MNRSGRIPDTVTKAVGEADDLLVAKLDITSRQDVEAAVQAAVDRFGGIDVLVNNAANFHAGYFGELTPEQMERQLATTLVGAMNVTRAVLSVMRKERSAKLVQALLTIAAHEQPPRRFIAGADAIALAEQRVAQPQEQIDAFRELSSSLARADVRTST